MSRARGALAGAALACLVLALLLFASFGLEGARARYGVRPLALALLLPGALLTALARGGGAHQPAPGLAGLGVPLVLFVAAASEDVRCLRLVPAAAYVAVAGVFFATLRQPPSLIERVVRAALPMAPEFIGGYCRRLTALWVGFFVVAALAIGAAAVGETLEVWRALTRWGVFAAMLLLSAAEFLFRKSWFRYYWFGGPFDRLWSRLFPAEATERGRRSAAYIREHRALRAARDGASRTP